MQKDQQNRGFLDIPTGRKFWVLVYIVPWFIVGFLTAIFLSSSSKSKGPSKVSKVPTVDDFEFSWESLPWVSNSVLTNPMIATFPISIHGNLKPEIDQIYRGAANITDPMYTSIISSCISHDGFVIHSEKEYPESQKMVKGKNGKMEQVGHPWFPSFSYKNFSQQPRNQKVYPRIISIPQPPQMSDYFFLANIFPIIFILPDDLIKSSTICFTRVSPAIQEFLKEVIPSIRYVTTESGSVCAEEIIIPKLSNNADVPQASDEILSDALNSNIQQAEFATALIMRDGDPALRRREYVTKKLADSSNKFIVMDKKWTLLEQIAAISNSLVAVGFGGDQLNLAMFMKKGSVVIEVQRDNVISRPVLIARALGLRVHVIAIRDGDHISDDVFNTILKIISN